MHGLIDQLLEAFNAHDASAIGSLMADDVEYVFWEGVEWRTIRGLAAVVEFLDALHDTWSSDFALTKSFVVADLSGFAVEYAETGTHDRGPNPSGRAFSLRNVMVGEVRAGKISRMTDYSDVTAYRSQTQPNERAS